MAPSGSNYVDNHFHLINRLVHLSWRVRSYKNVLSKPIPNLWFEGILRYRYTSPQIAHIEIEQDHQTQIINTQQTTPIHIKWPHAQDTFALSVHLKNGQKIKMAQENGPWGMIKFLSQSRKTHLHQRFYIEI